MLIYNLGRFAIVPWATQMRLISTEGDIICIQEELLETHISGSLAWSTVFSGRWTGRHKVISASGQRKGLGDEVVVSACSKVSLRKARSETLNKIA